MNYLTALESILAVVVLIVVVYGPWQSACTDLARQRMFRDRDALFDLARSGDLDFTSEHYQTIRSEMNNLIRFAHSLTWVRILLYARLVQETTLAPAPIYGAVNTIENLSVREAVSALVSDIEFAAIRMVVMKSPVLVMFGIVSVIPLAAWEICYAHARHSMKNLQEGIGVIIQNEAALIRA